MNQRHCAAKTKSSNSATVCGTPMRVRNWAKDICSCCNTAVLSEAKVGLPQKKGAQIARPQRWDARLDVQVLHIQRVFHDELTPRLDILAHERGEDILALLSKLA